MMQMRKQMAEETRRIQAIRSTCEGKHPDIEAQAIEEGWDVTKTELHVLRAPRPQVPVAIQGTGQSSRPSNPQVFEAVALMASGLPSSRVQALYAEPVLEAADKLRGIGVQEFCEMACGQQLPRFRRDATGWLQEVFSSASLPGVLSNIANKMLLEGYNYVEDAWRRIAKIASVNDFKEHTRYRMTGSFKFQQVGPDGEIKHGQLDEQQFGQKADTHGIMFALTRQMIINDDLGAFTDIPRQIGMGAAEAIAEAVWALTSQLNQSGIVTNAKRMVLPIHDLSQLRELTISVVPRGVQVKPLQGKVNGWAGGIVYFLVNEDSLACGIPGMLNADFEKLMDVSMETVRRRAACIRELVLS
jgi:hypothetical protein